MRSRRTLLVAAAAIGAVVLLFFLRPDVAGQVAAMAPLVAYGALFCLLSAAVVLAALAIYRTERTRAEFLRLSRTMEATIQAMTVRAGRDAQAIAELRQAIEEMRSEAPDGLQKPPIVSPMPDFVSGMDPQSAPSISQTNHPDWQIAEAIHAAIDGGGLELRLEPIVSIHDGAVSAFEVLAHLALPDGSTFDLRRLPDHVSGIAPSDFEGALLTAAMSAARRPFASDVTQPLHVPLSEALIGDAAHVDAAIELVEVRPELAAALTISIPSGVLAKGGAVGAGLDALALAGFRFALEMDDGSLSISSERMSKAEIRCLKIPAAALLAEDTGERVEPAELIATGVDSEQQAIALAERGVELMSGPHFAAAARLRQAARARSVSAQDHLPG